MTAPIPAVVVGTRFGCHTHVPALRAAGFDVVGLVGTTPDTLSARAAEANVARTFTDLDEAITATGAKVVTIATPPHTHAPLSLAAIARSCHVVCEKPFASNTAEAKAMLDAAEKAGIVHLIAHQFRWMPDRALFGRAIADGLIGEPRFFVHDQFVQYCADPATPLPRWWFDKAAGGGWLGASGSHLLDQIRAWLGDFAEVSAALFLVSDRKADADDSYSLRFRLKSGVEGSMQQSAGAWGPGTTQVRCMGTRGTVWMEGGKVLVADKDGTRELPVPDDLKAPVPAGAEAIAPFVHLCSALRARIEGREMGTPVPVPTFRDGLAEMEIIDAVRASAAHGGAVQTLG